MTRRVISTGSPFERAAGYSRALVQGPWCFVSGTTGYDYERMVMPDGIETQTENALATIGRVLDEAGFSLFDVVRAHYYIVDANDADAVFKVVGPAFAEIRPAATMIVCDLIRREMKIEIEVTALKA